MAWLDNHLLMLSKTTPQIKKYMYDSNSYGYLTKKEARLLKADNVIPDKWVDHYVENNVIVTEMIRRFECNDRSCFTEIGENGRPRSIMPLWHMPDPDNNSLVIDCRGSDFYKSLSVRDKKRLYRHFLNGGTRFCSTDGKTGPKDDYLRFFQLDQPAFQSLHDFYYPNFHESCFQTFYKIMYRSMIQTSISLIVPIFF
jgi:hypothetical protein